MTKFTQPESLSRTARRRATARRMPDGYQAARTIWRLAYVRLGFGPNEARRSARKSRKIIGSMEIGSSVAFRFSCKSGT
jgi:hypothetical protein